MLQEREITTETLLCTSNGKLNKEACGYSRFPLHVCNLSGNTFRKKRWNYWCFTNDEILFSVTLADLDYAGTGFIYLFDLKTLEFIEKTELIPFGKGCVMGEKVSDGVFFENSKMKISIEYAKVGDAYEIDFSIFCKSFQGDKNLKAELKTVQPMTHESLSVVIPWDEKHFQFTSKQHAIPTNGKIQIGKKEYLLKEENTDATLDFGRGIWRYSSSWNWASLSGKVNGKKIGLNFGAKWTDNSGYTENGIFYDGKLYKISEQILFGYDTSDYKKPWTHKTEETDRVNLTFHPIHDRIAETNFVLIASKVHQVFGYFEGYIRLGINQEKIQIPKLFGWSEEHYAKW
jgi:hypothetical protein